MAELIREHTTRIEADDGTLYLARTYGQERVDGTWEAWLEFHPVALAGIAGTAGGGAGNAGGAGGVGGIGLVLRTGRETSQSNREGVVYWASGLEPVYLEGAFARAV